MPKKHYQWELGEDPPEIEAHSLVKHDLYEDYLRVYVDRLTRNVCQERLVLTIVDGFCGGGLYRDGNLPVRGSPLRALYAVKEAELRLAVARRKGFKIDAHFYFVDSEKKHIDFLRDQLVKNDFGDRIGSSIHLLTNKFDCVYTDIVADIKRRNRRSHRAIFLLDQYGWSQVAFETIRKIFNDVAKPEVLLTFAVDFLIDYLSAECSRVDRGLGSINLARKDIEALIALKGNIAHRALIQNTLYQHLRAQTGAKFYSPFFLRSNSSNKDLWLVHLSNHRQARDEMGKIHWKLANKVSHHGRDGFNSLGFRPRLDLDQQLFDFNFTEEDWARSGAVVLEQLPYVIESMNRSASIEELFSSNCNDTPVVFDLVREQLVQLRDAKEVSVRSIDGSLRARTSDFAWTDLVTLNPQRTLFSISTSTFKR